MFKKFIKSIEEKRLKQLAKEGDHESAHKLAENYLENTNNPNRMIAFKCITKFL